MEVILLDCKGWRRLFSVNRQDGGIWSLTFSPDGKVLATSGIDDVVLFNARTGKALLRLTDKEELGANHVHFTPDGNRFLVHRVNVAKGGVWLYDWPSCKLLSKIDAAGAKSVQISKDGKTLTTVDANNEEARIKRCGLSKGKKPRLIRTIKKEDKGSYEPPILSPDSSLLGWVEFDGDVCLWDVASGKLLWRLHPLLKNPRVHDVCSCVFSGDGRWLAVRRIAGVDVWDLQKVLKKPSQPPTEKKSR